MKAKYILVNLMLMVFISGPGFGAESHSLFTAMLKDHVRNGLVNYKALRMDKRLDQYVGQLAQTNPDTIRSEKERLAFWINAYNAYTLKVIVDNYPVKSISDLHFGGRIVGTVLKKTIWDKEFVVINSKNMTLNTIEHKIIRPVFKDPRAHFALVCASKGCPPLRSEAYEGDKLDEQLNDQAREFLNDPSKNVFDATKKEAHISKIFSWFSEDFGGKDAKVLSYIASFLPKNIADQIRANPQAWKIHYIDYDWSLNEQPT